MIGWHTGGMVSRLPFPAVGRSRRFDSVGRIAPDGAEGWTRTGGRPVATHYTVRAVEKATQRIHMQSGIVPTVVDARKIRKAWRDAARTPKLWRFEILRHCVTIVR
jgi:hypothetical protein